jgi:hypothetical protein
MSKYGGWTRGNDEALLNKLGGEEVARRLLDCRKVKVVFDPTTKSATVTGVGVAPVFNIWRNIEVGTGLKTADDFRNALKQSGCRTSDFASSMFDDPKFTVSVAIKQNVKLCSATVAELEFEEATRYDKICARIIKLGYELCLPEDGPLLRLQYLKQPLDEWLWMAMNPLRDMGGSLDIFHVGHDEDGLWLDWDYGGPDGLFNPVHRFVFRLRK